MIFSLVVLYHNKERILNRLAAMMITICSVEEAEALGFDYVWEWRVGRKMGSDHALSLSNIYILEIYI